MPEIEIIKSPRPDTAEEEAEYWQRLYRDIMTVLDPVIVGSSSAVETLQRVIPELQELRKKKVSEQRVEQYEVQVKWNDDSGAFQTIGITDDIKASRHKAALSELPVVEIPLVNGVIILHRIDFCAIRFVKKV